MLFKMDYPTGRKFMIDKCRNGSRGQFKAYENIVINYPGYKKALGDYQLEIVGDRVPKHADICQRLYERIKGGSSTYEELNSLLFHVYHYGTTILSANEELKYLQNLIYWVTLQEEINYPRDKGYAGINLAFCRFFEAVYCTKSDMFCINDVYVRCNHYGKQRPELYKILEAPDYYHY